MSVLTDVRFFQGSFDNISLIRKAGNSLPILAKEFIIEAYQLFQARAAGADAVLLIAAVLPNSDLAYLLKAAAKVCGEVSCSCCPTKQIAEILSSLLTALCCHHVSKLANVQLASYSHCPNDDKTTSISKRSFDN